MPCQVNLAASEAILPGHLERALARGVRGFLPRRSPAHVLTDVVRTVHSEGRYVHPELAAAAISAGDNPLTPREADVLELATDGAPRRGDRPTRVSRPSPGSARPVEGDPRNRTDIV
jgi:two-component system response regulator DesR